MKAKTLIVLCLLTALTACKNEHTNKKEPTNQFVHSVNTNENLIGYKKVGQEPLPHGFKELRRLYKLHSIKPDGYKEEYFNNPRANALRNFTKNSLLDYEKVATYDLDGGTIYKEQWQFCADGTFYYVNSSLISVMPSGGGMGSLNGNNAISGYWDVISNHVNTILILYSEHPEIRQYSPNGFIPMLIKHYQNDVVRAAADEGDKLYGRQSSER